MFSNHAPRTSYDLLNPESVVTEEHITEVHQRGQMILERTGELPKDESEAPPIGDVEKQLLRDFVRDDTTLGDQMTKWVLKTVCRYRSWTKAMLEAEKELLEEKQRN